jgi:hypothetical protein
MKILGRLKRFVSRASLANVLIASFIIMTSIGGFLLAPPIGFIVCGVCSGVVGYLLGME